MSVEVKMPQLGLTMTEGTVAKWLKSVGDKVAVGDPLVEVETDKINNEVEAQAEGVLLAILVQEGEVAPVKAPLAVIGAEGESVDVAAAAPAAAPAAAEAAPAVEAPAAAPSAGGPARTEDGRIMASPIARRLAKEEGLDLGQMKGSGPGGRIVERDIKAAVAEGKYRISPLAAKIAAEKGVDPASLASDQRIMSKDVLGAATAAAPAAAKVEGKPLSGMRKVIAERMSQSWNLAPHVTFTVEVDMTEATNLRKRLAEVTGKKVSFTEIIAKACVTALPEFPYVNASLIDNKLVYHDAVHLGIAVALDDGLIVPVIKNAQAKNVIGLGEAVRELAEKARSNKLGPDEVSGGTFTITNLGMYGIDNFTPIINQPESAILGVCRTVEKQVVRNGAVEIRPMMNLCMSADHRVIDGAVAAKFLARLRQLLEQPLLMV